MLRNSRFQNIYFCRRTPLLLQRGGGGRTPGEGQYFDQNATPRLGQGQKIKLGNTGRTAQEVNPFSPEIKSFRRLLVIINPQSGWKEAAGAFAAYVTETLDTTGVIHKSRTVPPEDLKNVLREEAKVYPRWDGVLLCGGDGTINAYSYLMTVPEFADQWLNRPVAILPAGANNGIAHSLGFGNAGCTTASFITGRTREVPLWKATVHNHDDPPAKRDEGTLLSTSLAGVNFGVFADTLLTAERIKNYMLGYVVLPVLRKRNYFSSWYQIFVCMNEESAMPISIRYTTVKKEGITEGGEIKGLAPENGLQLLIASQVKWHHQGYSLTPKAEIGKVQIGQWRDEVDPYLSVTLAAGDCSKGRMMHLIQREGPEAELELDDGVESFNCQSIEISFNPERKIQVMKKGEKNAEQQQDILTKITSTIKSLFRRPKKFKKLKFLLDGEVCELLPGQTLKLAPAKINMKFMTP